MPADRLPNLGDANDWLARVATPAHAVLAIAGPIDPAEAVKLAREAFDNWSGPAGFADLPPLPEVGSPAVIVTHRPGATQAELTLGCRLAPVTSADDLADQVLARAVGAHFEVVRQATGTTYGFSVKSWVLRGGTSVLLLSGAVENAGLVDALRTIHTGLAESDWNQAIEEGQWALARGYNLSLATPEDWVDRALTVGRYGGDLSSVDQIPARISSVDRVRLVASLRRCAREGVLSLVGDEPIIRGALADTWR
jgi:predicted Zn-dependent peptidase